MVARTAVFMNVCMETKVELKLSVGRGMLDLPPHSQTALVHRRAGYARTRHKIVSVLG